MQTEKPRWDAAFCIWGYAVCLCPMPICEFKSTLEESHERLQSVISVISRIKQHNDYMILIPCMKTTQFLGPM